MKGFRLGSIFGFEISVDLSWFLIFFLVLWSLTASLFPANEPILTDAYRAELEIYGKENQFVHADRP